MRYLRHVRTPALACVMLICLGQSSAFPQGKTPGPEASADSAGVSRADSAGGGESDSSEGAKGGGTPVPGTTPPAKSVADVQKIVESAESVLADLSKLKGAVSINANGDETSERDFFQLRTDAAIKRGVYPRQWEFAVNTNFRYDRGELKEDVTKLLANYDYHVSRPIELFGFIERFSDSYLDIDERYEVGIGLKLEGESGATEVGDSAKVFVGRFIKAYDAKEVTVSTVGGKKRLSDLKVIKDNKETISTAIKKEHSRFRYGFGFTVFKEVEHVTIKTKSVPPADSVEAKDIEVELDTTQRFRAVIWPALTWYVTDELKLNGRGYMKLPLGHPYTRDDRLDYRFDMRLEAVLDLKSDILGADKVSVVAAYELHYDNLPPYIPQDKVDSLIGLGLTPQSVAAADTHKSYSLSLKVSF